MLEEAQALVVSSSVQMQQQQHCPQGEAVLLLVDSAAVMT